MPKKHSKRFYKNVSTEKSEDGWVVKLDTFILKTPGKKNLYLPNQDLAFLVANEWDNQDEHIRPSLMPLTRLLNVAVEQTPHNRSKLIAEARKYGETDTLCYREGKVRLHREEQEKKWSPILEWAASRSVFLKKTTSIMAIKQEESSLIAIDKYASELCNLKLTLFLHLVSVYGSVVLAMAVMEARLNGDEAFNLSRLDQIWQHKYWGEDEEDAERINDLRVEINELCGILKFI